MVQKDGRGVALIIWPTSSYWERQDDVDAHAWYSADSSKCTCHLSELWKSVRFIMKYFHTAEASWKWQRSMKICSPSPRGKAYQIGRWPLETKYRSCLAMVVSFTITALTRVDPKLVESIPLASFEALPARQPPSGIRPSFQTLPHGSQIFWTFAHIDWPSRRLLPSSHLHETCHDKEVEWGW